MSPVALSQNKVAVFRRVQNVHCLNITFLIFFGPGDTALEPILKGDSSVLPKHYIMFTVLTLSSPLSASFCGSARIGP